MMGKKADQEDKLVAELDADMFLFMWKEVIVAIIGMVWSYWKFTPTNWKVLFIIWPLLILLILYAGIEHYSLVFDKEGCTKKCMLYKRKYRWDELIVRQEYSEKIEDTYVCDTYKEGVVFLTKRKTTKRKTGIGTYTALHPFSSMAVNFKGTYIFGYNYLARGSEVNKEQFFRKMEEWGVSIDRVNVEKTSEVPIQLVAQIDEKYEKTVLIMKMICFVPLIIGGIVVTVDSIIHSTEDGIIMVLIAWGVLLFFIISDWYNFCKVIIDEQGCTKIWWKYKKKYTWEELTVRRIYAPIGFFQEGVLLATDWKFPREKDPKWYYYLHPFSSIVINFKGSRKDGIRVSEYCSVDKELLLQCLAEWGIELEDARKKENK